MLSMIFRPDAYDGVWYGCGYSAGLKYALVFAIFSALANLIPYVSP